MRTSGDYSRRSRRRSRRTRHTGEAFDDVVPHLTVADLGTLARRQQAQQQAQGGLPITSRVAAVHVIAGRREAGSWRIVHVAPLGGAGIG
jgi:hypothetical protein